MCEPQHTIQFFFKEEAINLRVKFGKKARSAVNGYLLKVNRKDPNNN